MENKLSYRAVKIVNSAISFTNVISFNDEEEKMTAEGLYNKIHNYGNIRPGLINNTYAIKQYLAGVVDTVYIDLDTGIKRPAADIIMINNNSRYAIDIDSTKLKKVKLKENIACEPKAKTILYIDKDLNINVITLDQLKSLVDGDSNA